MRPLRTFTPAWPLLAALPFLWTCCPTVWLQVEKDSPAPWPVVAVAGIDESPYTIPATAPNRFDVLVGGVPTLDAPDFTDGIDPTDSAGVLAHALQGLAKIETTYGKPAPPSCKSPMRATLKCLNPKAKGLAALCNELVLDAPVARAAAVVIKGTLLAVRNPPDPLHPTADLNLSLSLPKQTDEPEETVDVCVQDTVQLSRTLLSFVHLSDIQIRDPSITLTDRTLSHQLDWFDPLGSFEYDEDLASYNPYVLEAVVATINATVRKTPTEADRPRFVIHTGDSIDAGAMGELRRFHQLVDRLQIPFYELFGNHDVLVFGNLTPTITHKSDATCTPISALANVPTWLAPKDSKLCVDAQVRCDTCVGTESELVTWQPDPKQQPSHENTRKRFMTELSHDRADLLPQVAPSGPGSYCAGTAPKVWNDAYSRAHGFDLGTADGRLDGPKLGYYAFATPLLTGSGPSRHAVFIALDSEELRKGEGGVTGRISHGQLAWLRDVLGCVKKDHPRDLVFVLAHQPLSQIHVDDEDLDSKEPNRSVSDVLDASPNVVGYLYGHAHRHSICGDGRTGHCSRYWEVETASLIEFPQEGRLVRIKQVSDDLAFLELTALRERLADQGTELARYVALARRGAERDYCHTHRETDVRCSRDKRPYRADGRDANARLFFRLP